jgi:hypothetical protein
VSTEDSLSRAEELLARLEAARMELEQLSQAEAGSPERAIELLGELAELAKAVEEELERAKRAAELEAPPAKPATPGGEDRPAFGRPGEADAQS